jgi:hypothetical protein
MYVNEKRIKKIIIENFGDFNFDYVIKKKNSQYVTFTKEHGTV